jgi:hypothetical protein
MKIFLIKPTWKKGKEDFELPISIKKNSLSTTSTEKNRINNVITSKNADAIYKNLSGSNRYQREKHCEIIKKGLNKIQFSKLTDAYTKRNYLKSTRCLEKFNLQQITDDLWKYFDTFQIAKKPKFLWSDKFNWVKQYKWYFC